MSILVDDRGQPVRRLASASALVDRSLARLERVNQPVEQATWGAAQVNDLPDSSFLYIEPGGEKDDQGKTTPRSLRHMPIKDGEGNVDMPHLRAALSRLGQSDTGTSGGDKWLTADLRKELTAKCRRMLEEAHKE